MKGLIFDLLDVRSEIVLNNKNTKGKQPIILTFFYIFLVSFLIEYGVKSKKRKADEADLDDIWNLIDKSEKKYDPLLNTNSPFVTTSLSLLFVKDTPPRFTVKCTYHTRVITYTLNVVPNIVRLREYEMITLDKWNTKLMHSPTDVQKKFKSFNQVLLRTKILFFVSLSLFFNLILKIFLSPSLCRCCLPFYSPSITVFLSFKLLLSLLLTLF